MISRFKGLLAYILILMVVQTRREAMVADGSCKNARTSNAGWRTQGRYMNRSETPSVNSMALMTENCWAYSVVSFCIGLKLDIWCSGIPDFAYWTYSEDNSINSSLRRVYTIYPGLKSVHVDSVGPSGTRAPALLFSLASLVKRLRFLRYRAGFDIIL